MHLINRSLHSTHQASHSQFGIVTDSGPWAVPSYRAVFKYAEQGDPSAYRCDLYHVNFNDKSAAFGNRKLQDALKERQLALCDNEKPCADCRSDFSANFAHVDCYQLARQLIPTLSVHDLVLLARLTRTILPCHVMPARSSSQVDLTTIPLLGMDDASATPPDGKASEASLSRILGSIRRSMPAELKQMVFDQTTDLFRALIDCAKHLRASHALLSTFKAKNPDARTLPLSDAAPTDTLGVNMVTIRDEACVLDLGYGEGVWDHKISITGAEIDGIEVSYGTYGVTAMRFLYRDGSNSPWLGGRSRKFVKFSRGVHLERLQAAFDVSANPILSNMPMPRSESC